MALLATFRSWIHKWRRKSLIICHREYEYRLYLESIWEPPSLTPDVQDAPEESEHRKTDDVVRFSRRPPPPLDWKIAFTAAFSKAIAMADRSMQGRILLALAELSTDPATPRGDTIKPLVGNKQGLWRYRLGDFRLVYEPNASERMVLLVDFVPRGGVYE